MVVGAMPWMVIRPVIADEGMVRGPRAPGMVCIDRPERSAARRDGEGRRERRSNVREGKGTFSQPVAAFSDKQHKVFCNSFVNQCVEACWVILVQMSIELDGRGSKRFK